MASDAEVGQRQLVDAIEPGLERLAELDEPVRGLAARLQGDLDERAAAG